MKKFFLFLIFALLALSATAIAQDAPEPVLLDAEDDMILHVADDRPEPVLIDAGEEELIIAPGPAEASEVKPGLGPDSPLYGLELALERVRLGLTFNKKKKAELHVKYAEERLAEVMAMQAENKAEHAAKAAEKQKKSIDEAEEAMNEAEEEGEDVSEVETKLVAIKARNIEVLTVLLDKVPEQAKASIQKNIERSQQKRVKTVKTKEDCKKIEDVEERDSCYMGIALSKNDFTVCPKVTDELLRNSCLSLSPEEIEVEEEMEDEEETEVEVEEETDEEEEEEVEKEETEEVEVEVSPGVKEGSLSVKGAKATKEEYKCQSKIDGRVVLFYIKGDTVKAEYFGYPKKHLVYKEGMLYSWSSSGGEKISEKDIAGVETELLTLDDLSETAVEVDCSKYSFSENLVFNPPLYINFVDLAGEETEDVQAVQS